MQRKSVLTSLLLSGVMGLTAIGVGLGTGCGPIEYNGTHPIMVRVLKPAAEPEKPPMEPVKAERDPLKDFLDSLAGLTIHFDYDKASIKGDDNDKLQKISDGLKQFGQVSVRIEGNCDERGTADYNLALGDRRARTAKSYLTRLGVKKGRLRTVSNGVNNPVTQGHDEDSWAQNRRDDFKGSVQ